MAEVTPDRHRAAPARRRRRRGRVAAAGQPAARAGLHPPRRGRPYRAPRRRQAAARARRCGSSNWPARPAATATPRRCASCSNSTRRPSTPSPRGELPLVATRFRCRRRRESRVALDVDTVIRIGTRGSLLATTQAGIVRDALRGQRATPPNWSSSPPTGDRSSSPDRRDRRRRVHRRAARGHRRRPGRHGRALLQGFADRAPIPGSSSPRYPRAKTPRDALVARDGLVLGELPAGSVIGTSSPRRAAQLRALGLGLEIRPLRGNLDTRLNRVSSGDLDGVVVARAGSGPHRTARRCHRDARAGADVASAGSGCARGRVPRG